MEDYASSSLLPSQVECLTCGTMSFTYEQFQCLALPIPELDGPNLGIEECFRAYLCREIVGSHQQQHQQWQGGGGRIDTSTLPPPMSPSCKWRCPKCNVPRHFSKKIDLLRLPDVLVVSLNRFHSSSDRSSRPKKVNDLIHFPLDHLDLSFTLPSPSSSKAGKPSYSSSATAANSSRLAAAAAASSSPSSSSSCIFDLFCVSNHIGSMSRGHYTASCRTLEGNWFAFNDCIVSPLRDALDVVSAEAYVLFYVRRS